MAPFVLATINPGVLPPFIVYLYFYMYPLRFRFLSCLHDRFRVYILYYRLSFGSLCACAIGSGHLICIMFFVFFIFSYASPWRRIGVTFPTSCVVVVVFALVLSTSSTLSTHYYLPSHLCCVPRIEIRETRPPYLLPPLSESRRPGVWCVFSSTLLLEGQTLNLRKSYFPPPYHKHLFPSFSSLIAATATDYFGA